MGKVIVVGGTVSSAADDDDDETCVEVFVTFGLDCCMAASVRLNPSQWFIDSANNV